MPRPRCHPGWPPRPRRCTDMHEHGPRNGRHTRRGRACGAAAVVAAVLLIAGSPARTEDARPLQPALFVATLDRLAWEVRAATPEEAPALADRLPAEWTVQAGSDRFT